MWQRDRAGRLSVESLGQDRAVVTSCAQELPAPPAVGAAGQGIWPREEREGISIYLVSGQIKTGI